MYDELCGDREDSELRGALPVPLSEPAEANAKGILQYSITAG